MKAKIISLILILFLSSCSFNSDKKKELINDKKIIINEESSNDIKSKSTVNTESGKLIELNKKREIKEVLLYSELTGLNKEYKIRLKSGLITFKNSIDNIVSNCDYLEGKTEYLLNSGEKDEIGKKSSIDIGIENLKEEKRLDELDDLQKLQSGVVQGKYKLIKDKNFDRANYKDARQFYSYFGGYIYFIKDKNIASEYIDLYLSELKKEDEIKDENYVLPLIASYYHHNKTCKSFVEENFISY